MVGYDPWHWGDYGWNRSRLKKTTSANDNATSIKAIAVPSVSVRDALTEARDALVDIAYDSGSLEAARKRAINALNKT